MFRRQRLLLAAALSLVALAAGVSQASATSISFAGAGEVSLASVGSATFGFSGFSACDITLGGTLASGPITATPGAQIGSITSFAWSRCSGVPPAWYSGAPWPLRFQALSPAEEEGWENDGLVVTVDDMDWNYSFYNGCVNGRYEGDPEFRIELVPTRTPGVHSSGPAYSNEETTIPRIGGSGCFPGELTLSGQFALAPEQTVTIE